MRWTVQYTQFLLVCLILDKNTWYQYTTSLISKSSSHSLPYSFHFGCNVKHVGLVQVPVVTHKHNVPYIIYKIITRADYFRFRWALCVQLLFTQYTVSSTQSHGHHTPILTLHAMVYCILCIHPYEYLIYTRRYKTYFSSRVQWKNLNSLLNSPSRKCYSSITSSSRNPRTSISQVWTPSL